MSSSTPVSPVGKRLKTMKEDQNIEGQKIGGNESINPKTTAAPTTTTIETEEAAQAHIEPSSISHSDAKPNFSSPNKLNPPPLSVQFTQSNRSVAGEADEDSDDEDTEMPDAYAHPHPGIIVLDDNDGSETTGHSVDQDDYMEEYSHEDSEENLVYLDDVTDSDSGDSSGYIGYENAVAGRYYYDHEDDSLDMESDEEEHDGINYYSPEEYLQYDPTPEHSYPKPEWITLNELRARKCGFASSKSFGRRQNISWFERYAGNSLYMIQRLELVKKLDHHTGCVNSLGFSRSARLLCSGSDDLDVCIWDWQRDSNQLRDELNTGHNSNVFQSVFCNQDTNIVTSSRDGSVRLLDIETRQNEKLISAAGEIQKLAFISEETFLTCGTNAAVNLVDLRTRETRKLFTVRNPKSNQTCQLHCINSHPLDKHMIAVAGQSPYVFLYDLRRLPRELHDPEIKPTYNLGNLDKSDVRVTSTAFNSTGDKLLISYNDDDLYVCRTDTCEIIHRYQGHRNMKTYKGCAWFGDNFVLSGSDDGHIYGWDLESEHIVCFLQGDRGIVSCLLVHPTLPILVSSGLESDIKIWEPVADVWPRTMKGIKPQICKNTRRKLARSPYAIRRALVGANLRDRDHNDGSTTNDQEGDDDEEDEDAHSDPD